MQTDIEWRPYLNGHLEVHVTRDDDGNVTREVFAFSSLADVLDVPMSTLEGRYARSPLKQIKVNIRTGAGRPARGFLLTHLDDVLAVLAGPGALPASESKPEPSAPYRPSTGELVPVIHNGEPHYTIQSLADYYGVTAQTIRNRIRAAQLEARLVPTTSTPQGGRPRLAFRHVDMPVVHVAVGGGAPMPQLATTDTDPDENPILYALRRAGMASASRADRESAADNLELINLAREIESMVVSVPTPTKPVVVDDRPDRVEIPRVNTDALARYTSAESFYAGVTEQGKHFALNRSLFADDDLTSIVSALNQQGSGIGLSTSIAALAEYVRMLRARVQRHMQPYMDIMGAMVDALPDGEDEADVLRGYALRIAMLRTLPVYVSMVPYVSIARKVRVRGHTTTWDTLAELPSEDNHSDKAERQRHKRLMLMESPEFVEPYNQYKVELVEAKARADDEFGVNVTFDPNKNGWLRVPDDVWYALAEPFTPEWNIPTP